MRIQFNMTYIYTHIGFLISPFQNSLWFFISFDNGKPGKACTKKNVKKELTSLEIKSANFGGTKYWF